MLIYSSFIVLSWNLSTSCYFMWKAKWTNSITQGSSWRLFSNSHWTLHNIWRKKRTKDGPGKYYYSDFYLFIAYPAHWSSHFLSWIWRSNFFGIALGNLSSYVMICLQWRPPIYKPIVNFALNIYTVNHSHDFYLQQCLKTFTMFGSPYYRGWERDLQVHVYVFKFMLRG